MSIALTETSTMIYFILTVFLLFSYNFLLFKLVGNFLEKPLLNSKQVLPICLLNTIMYLLFMFIYHSSASMLYLCLIIIFTVEFYMFHKERLLRVIFIALGCIIHVVIVRAVVISSIGLVCHLSIYEVVSMTAPAIISTLLSTGILNIALIIVLKLMPAQKMKILNQHSEQLYFMVACFSVIMFYFVANSLLFTVVPTTTLLNLLQITIALVMLAIAYIALFYSFKTTLLLGYKDINSELQTEIYKEQQYRNSMMTNSIAVYEFNITKNQIISGFEELKKDLEQVENMTLSEVIGRLIKERIHPGDQKMFSRYFNIVHFKKALAKDNHEVTMEYRRKTDDGQWCWVRNVITLMVNIDDDIEGYMYVKDIDAVKKEEIELKFRAERDSLTKLNNKEKTEELISDYLMNDVYGKPSGTLFIIDIDNFKTVNDGLGHLYGDQVLLEISAALEKLFRDDDIVGRIGGDEFMAFMKGSHHKEAIEKKAETICTCFNRQYQGTEGSVYTISASVGIAVAPVHGETFAQLYRMADIAAYSSKNHGKNTYTIYEGEEFKEYKGNRREIDELTGSISFFQFKEEASRRLQCNKEENLLFVRIDINDFQLIKGLLGFKTEDEILRDIGKAIKATIQSNDIYARMANDNFVVLTSYLDETDIYSQGARFKENFRKHHFSIERNYEVTFKIGFSKIENEEQDIEAIIEMANQAHELAKKQNKAMYSYNETLKGNLELAERIKSNMEKALENNEFQFYLHPRYRLKTSQMVGGEASLCWIRNDKIVEPSDVFMPIFVKSGFIRKMDLVQIKQAAELIKKRMDQGKTPLAIALKQSSQSILSDHYVDDVLDILKSITIDPQFIELEITESTFYENRERVSSNMLALRSLGFKVIIDEFGNGSSSLTIFNELQCDAVKIDNTILFLAIDNTEYIELFRNLLATAQRFGVQIITERVESNQQIELLLELEDALTQGYLYVKPIPVDDFIKQ